MAANLIENTADISDRFGLEGVSKQMLSRARRLETCDLDVEGFRSHGFGVGGYNSRREYDAFRGGDTVSYTKVSGKRYRDGDDIYSKRRTAPRRGLKIFVVQTIPKVRR